MKVRISYIVDADDDLRRAVNQWYGRPGLANRDEVKNWYENNGRSMDLDLSVSAESEYGQQEWTDE